MTIQKENGGVGSEEWFTLYRDEGPQTTVSMKRQWDLSTVVEVKWRIAADEKASRYRICHQGSSQFLWQSRTPYKACSPVFSIRP
ncbi:MAG: hypothetical protein EOP07_23835 [Proteobacteria bacterium]|nr:MAG: hypothetical protein EOP07_23835 [Pseudomonadota bacterium]